MDLFINTPGTYLKVHQEMFEIKTEEKKVHLSPLKVSSIVISVHALLTTDVIQLALKHNIDIVLADETGFPIGRFWHSRFGSISTIRRKQSELFGKMAGSEIVREWMIRKIQNSMDHIDDLKKRRKAKAEELNQKKQEINIFVEKIEGLSGKPEEIRQTLMGYEGNASKIYFRLLSHLLPKEWQFKTRSSRPAKDAFNAFLNYGFGILYNRVERACIIAGLDPSVGILHTDNYNKKSLVFDMIEQYRHMVIEPVFKLFTSKKVNQTYIDEIINGVSLNKEGRQLTASVVIGELESKTKYRGRMLKKAEMIQSDCHRLANDLLNDVWS